MRARQVICSREILRAATAGVVVFGMSAAVADGATLSLPIYDGLNYSATGNPPLGTANSNNAGSVGQWLYQGTIPPSRE
jgi:hypothetical protein